MNAIGYIRRSTNRQEESLDQQRSKLQGFAAAHGWTLSEIYVDDAISGSDMTRPGLDAMMNRAQQDKEVGIVLAWERNRLARPKDPVDGLMLERKLLIAGKRVFYVATGQEADRSFASGLIGYVEHYQNGDYLRKLSRDTMRGHVARAERGLWCGGPIPYGFDRLYTTMDGKPKRILRDMSDRTQHVLHPETGALIEIIPPGLRYTKPEFELCTLVLSDPVRVHAIQKMFADYAAGLPIRVLRNNLNKAGLRTIRGRIFTIPTIHSMLDNPAYAGISVYNQRTESKWHRHSGGQSVERLDEGLELRPESDWIVKPNAWPAIIDEGLHKKIQARRKDCKENHRHTVGTSIHGNYFLSHCFLCGVCGGRLCGQTTTSGKGYRTRYYICSTHHNGDHERCPTRYKIPADTVEPHILSLIKRDLLKLADDPQLQEYIAEEIARLSGNDDDARQQLQRRLAELDQQTAKLRDHLKALDAVTAQALGLYDEAKTAAEERKNLEAELHRLQRKLPQLPDMRDIAERSRQEIEHMDDIFASGTVDQKKEFVAIYVKTIEADPNAKSVKISLFPALFSQILAGGGFEPPTSGL